MSDTELEKKLRAAADKVLATSQHGSLNEAAWRIDVGERERAGDHLAELLSKTQVGNVSKTGAGLRRRGVAFCHELARLFSIGSRRTWKSSALR